MLAAAMLAACGSAAVPEPTLADASRGAAHFPDVTLGELQRGRALYVSRCGSCHTLKRPVELPPEQWQEEVSEMRSKNGVKLSDAEAQAIVRYLAVAASAG
jgi:mono/diheme cytochrome c family protein